jgi:hypothetical protein
VKIQEKIPEIKRFLRAAKDGFEKVAVDDGKQYTVSFALALAKPVQDASASFVKSYLESIQKAISAFPQSDILAVQVDIIDQDSFEHKLVKETRDAFETSQKLEAPLSKKDLSLATAGGESA